MNLDDVFQQLFRDEDEERPNKVTLYIGDAIKKARQEHGFSQEELAKKIYLRRATLSNIENGNSEPNASNLIMLAHVLEKPVAYFLPDYLYERRQEENLSPLESELLFHFRKIRDESLMRVAVQQVKQLGDFDPTELVVNLVDIIDSKIERYDEITQNIQKHKKLRSKNI